MAHAVIVGRVDPSLMDRIRRDAKSLRKSLESKAAKRRDFHREASRAVWTAAWAEASK